MGETFADFIQGLYWLIAILVALIVVLILVIVWLVFG